MDAEQTSDESTDAPTRPVRTRPAPGPRPSEAPAETSRPEPRSRKVERRTTEIREQPSHEQPVPEQPVPEQLVAEQPNREQPVREQPVREQPSREQPSREQPSGELSTGNIRGAEYRGGEYRGAEPTAPTNIYRARRPAVAVLLIIPAIGVGLLLIRALAIAAFGPTFLIQGVIASACALAALPLIVAGLYGLVTGAAHGAEQYGFKVWARPPLAYLLVGLAFTLAAGLAIR